MECLKTSGVGPGEMISFKANMNIHLTVILVYHKNHTSIAVEYGEITIPNIFALKKQRDMDSTKETKPKYPTIDL